MKYIVERIEEKIASLENLKTGEMISFNISEIPFDIREGDCLIFEENNWKTDEIEKQKRKEIIRKKMQYLWGE